MPVDLSLPVLVIIAAHLFALGHVLTSTTTAGSKIGWTMAVLILPVLGFLGWLIAGPRQYVTHH